MTDLSRRGLLGASFLAVVLAPFVDTTEAFAARKHGRHHYSRKRFKPLLGRRSRLTGPATRTPVRLIRIDNLSSAARGDEHRFALVFRATKAGPPQGTYTLRRRGFAPTQLFLVPDASRRTYVAVVNRAG